MTDWTMQIFQCKNYNLKNPEPIVTHVGGWVKGHFGLDPRNYQLSDWGDEVAKGWVITHIPTGYAVRTIKVSCPEKAKEIADIIAAACDWDFSDPAQSKALVETMKALMAEHSEIANQADFHNALWLDHP